MNSRMRFQDPTSFHQQPPKEACACPEEFPGLRGVKGRSLRVRSKHAVFAQGDPAKTVFYIQEGKVRISVVSNSGREAILADLGPNQFFGEACLAGHSSRLDAATALEDSTIFAIEQGEMRRVLHEQSALASFFISCELSRITRLEQECIDHILNSSEKRLARALCMMAGEGKTHCSESVLPKISQEILAEMIGTTRSRVNILMNKFKKLGLIEYSGGLRVKSSLASVILRD